ncbi:thioredoxin family protein [Schlesneria paludicola]|uniref:thioredoxin family protein n=1 Tax=Schlesneria paludicola TaxID=360056 RepID=UPI00029A6D85|nr:thioredoxin family protein [Schlesneria paludicola]
MSELTREELDQRGGATVVEFGTSWCPHCQTIQSKMASLLTQYPQIQHLKIEDGPGQRLGRSFQVKLWPTLVFMREGRVIGQVVRPSQKEMEDGFSTLASAAGD